MLRNQTLARRDIDRTSTAQRPELRLRTTTQATHSRAIKTSPEYGYKINLLQMEYRDEAVRAWRIRTSAALLEIGNHELTNYYRTIFPDVKAIISRAFRPRGHRYRNGCAARCSTPRRVDMIAYRRTGPHGHWPATAPHIAGQSQATLALPKPTSSGHHGGDG